MAELPKAPPQGMPSGRTSMQEPPANDLLAIHPACSGRRHRQPCRRPHERKLGSQTKDDIDKEPREEWSCGRSQTLLYNCPVHIRALTAALRIKPPSPRCRSARQPNPGRGSTYRCGDSVQTIGTGSHFDSRFRRSADPLESFTGCVPSGSDLSVRSCERPTDRCQARFCAQALGQQAD